MMPGCPGSTRSARSGADPALADLPVILLTARAQESDVETGFDSGADDYITKPFSPRELASPGRGAARRATLSDVGTARRSYADGAASPCAAGMPSDYPCVVHGWHNCLLAPVHVVRTSAEATRRPREDTMKKDIHPDYVETQVTCTCGAQFTTRSTATTGVDPRRRVLAVPPVLHRQAEDPRHRRPRRPLRGPLRQEGCRAKK